MRYATIKVIYITDNKMRLDEQGVKYVGSLGGH